MLESSNSIVDRVIKQLKPYKSGLILTLGNTQSLFFMTLKSYGFKTLEISPNLKSGRTFDFEDICECFKVLDSHDDISFILALDGGPYADLAKVLAIKGYYKNDIRDFYKKIVRPYNAIPFGIICDKRFDGNEKNDVGLLEDKKHHFIYSLQNDFFKAKFIESMNDETFSLEDRVWSYLNTGNASILDKSIPCPTLHYEVSKDLAKIKGLTLFLMGKLTEATRAEAVLAVVSYMNCEEARILEKTLFKYKVPLISIPDEIKTKLKAKAC